MEPNDPQFDLTFMELMRDVLHHVADEGDDAAGALMAPRASSGNGWMVGAGALLAGLYLLRRRA